MKPLVLAVCCLLASVPVRAQNALVPGEGDSSARLKAFFAESLSGDDIADMDRCGQGRSYTKREFSVSAVREREIEIQCVATGTSVVETADASAADRPVRQEIKRTIPADKLAKHGVSVRLEASGPIPVALVPRSRWTFVLWDERLSQKIPEAAVDRAFKQSLDERGSSRIVDELNRLRRERDQILREREAETKAKGVLDDPNPPGAL